MCPLKVMSSAEAATKYAGLRKSPITRIVEYQELMVKLGDGLRRAEAVVIELPIDPKSPHARASFKRAAIKMIRRLKLGYSVRAMRSGDTDVIIVANDEQPVSPPLQEVRRKVR